MFVASTGYQFYGMKMNGHMDDDCELYANSRYANEIGNEFTSDGIFAGSVIFCFLIGFIILQYFLLMYVF